MKKKHSELTRSLLLGRRKRPKEEIHAWGPVQKKKQKLEKKTPQGNGVQGKGEG